MQFPSPLSDHYRVASPREIRSWSFGALTSARKAGAGFQDHIPGTLHDQAIFGTIRDFQCACGKFADERYARMICDQCRVKIAPSTVRGSRFAHVEFPESVPHPFDAEILLACFPVLPIRFAQSPGGHDLLKLYDQLVIAANRSANEIEKPLDALFDFLTPVVLSLDAWQIPTARTLARGLALTPENSEGNSPEYCSHCGYLTAGLPVTLCPACQSPLER